LSIFAIPRLTFGFCIIAIFLHKRSNGMTTDIGSLASGMDGHVIRLGIGRMALRKTVQPLQFQRAPIAWPTFLNTTINPFGTTDQVFPSSFPSSLH
jgi:hypothetical protein